MPASSQTVAPSTPGGVSIVIPAYNYEKFVAQALNSALAQQYPGDLEVLVIDDGSTDATPEVVKAFGGGVTYHRKVNGGLSAARNTGMELARHDWVVFLDADDELEPNAVAEFVNARDAAADRPVVVGSAGRMIDANGDWLTPGGATLAGDVKTFTYHDFVLRNRFAPIVLADRAVLLSLGGFDPALKASEDRDMWIRAATKGPILMLQRSLYRKRDHGTNMSRHAVRQTQSIFQVLEKASGNPAVGMTKSLQHEAEAVCLYQSARMHLAAGDRAEALRQCARSILRSPWVSRADSCGYPRGFRLKFLLLGLVRGLRGAEDSSVPRTALENRPADSTSTT